jgi:hypothetical protein
MTQCRVAEQHLRGRLEDSRHQQVWNLYDRRCATAFRDLDLAGDLRRDQPEESVQAEGHLGFGVRLVQQLQAEVLYQPPVGRALHAF